MLSWLRMCHFAVQQSETHLHLFFTCELYVIFFLWRYLTVRQSWALWGIWTLKWNVNLLFAQSGPESSLLLSANKKIDEIGDGWNKNSSQSCTRSISLTQSRRPSFSVSFLLVLFFCVRGSQSGCVPVLSVLWQRQNTPATQSSAADNSTKNNLQSLSFYFFLPLFFSLSVCLRLNSSASAPLLSDSYLGTHYTNKSLISDVIYKISVNSVETNRIISDQLYTDFL